MNAVDDLHVGNWIALSGDKHEPSQSHWFGPPPPSIHYSGEPCQIIAISLPFLCVWLPKHDKADTIDVRRYNVVKLHRTYVRRMLELPTLTVPNLTDDVSAELIDEGGDGLCPNCGHSLRERMIAGDEIGWHLHCIECGFKGMLP